MSEQIEKIVYSSSQIIDCIRVRIADHKNIYIKKFQLNEITGKIEIVYTNDTIEEVTDEFHSVIFNAAYTYVHTHGKQFSTEAHINHAIKEVALDNRYNPIKNYLMRCRDAYEAIKHPQIESELHKLLQSVIPQDEAQEAHIDIFLSKWLVGCVARVFFQHQNAMLLIQGKQGIGKSTFFSKLCKNISKYYTEQEIVWRDKDSQSHLASKFIWNLDEFGTMLKTKDRNAVKKFLTLEHFDYRRPYAHFGKMLERICSFAGTTNDLDLLTDPTGNRRYLIIQVEKFDFDKLNSVDPDLLWGELTSLAFADASNYTLTEDEKKLQASQNSKVEIIMPLVELFFLWLEPDPDGVVKYIDVETKILKEPGSSHNRFSLRYEIADAMLKIGAVKYTHSKYRGYKGFKWKKGHHPSATLESREIEALRRENPRETH